MADDLNLNLQLLKAQLPGLHRDAQAGDAGARRELVRVVGMITAMEGRARSGDRPEQGGGRGLTASPALPGQAESKASKAALGAWLSERQRAGSAPPPWLELYDDLLDEKGEDGKQRWDWRKALFIAWSCVPRGQREPKTIQELANMLGVRPSTVRKWRLHDPEIVDRISAAPRRMLLEHVADVYAALVEVATQADPRAFQDRRLFLEMTGDYSPKAKLEAEVETVGMTLEEWRVRQQERMAQAHETMAIFEGDGE